MKDYVAELLGLKDGGMPPRNKKYYRSTKSGAGMTSAGVAAYRRMNPGSKLSTAVTLLTDKYSGPGLTSA